MPHQKIPTTRPSFPKRLWTAYCQSLRRYPPICGFDVLCDPDSSRTRKATWLVAMVPMVAFAVFSSRAVLEDYFTYKVTVSFDRSSNFTLAFPDVTICNANRWRRSRLCAEGNASLVDFTMASLVCSPQARDFNLSFSRNLSETVLMLITRDDSRNGTWMAGTYGHQLDDMLVDCQIGQRNCTDSRYFKPVMTASGWCYSLDTGAFGEGGYLDPSHGDPADHGLELILNTEVEEYLPITRDQGFLVMIQDRGTTPTSSTDGVFIPASYTSYVGLDVMVQLGLPPPFQNPCTGDWPQHLLPYLFDVPKYTKRDCVRTCLQAVLLMQCGCQSVRLPLVYQGDDTIRYCEDEETTSQCVSDVSSGGTVDRIRWGARSSQAKASPLPRTGRQRDRSFTAAFQEEATEKFEKACGCYRPCRETTYERQLSLTALRSANDASTSAQPQRSLCRLVVYFKSLQYDVIQTRPMYDGFEVLSAVGSIYGMYLGLSFYGAFQFVELFVYVAIRCSSYSRRR